MPVSAMKPAADPEQTLILGLDGGDVCIDLRPDLAPNHVARIKELVRAGFYDGLTFHRVIEGFIAQTGCPEGIGSGGSGQTLHAEFSNVAHRRSVVSMARARSPHSADSQFFICLQDAGFLDGKYTVVGKVVSGMDQIDALPRGEPPAEPGRILFARVAADVR